MPASKEAGLSLSGGVLWERFVVLPASWGADVNVKPGACLECSEVRSLAGITQHSREKEIR